MDNPALSSASFIASQSTHVKINQENVKVAAKIIMEGMKTISYDITSWHQNVLHPPTKDLTALNWFFFFFFLIGFFYESIFNPFLISYNNNKSGFF